MSSTVRKATPRGQMTRGANSGPAVMLMPPDIRSTFMPNPPLQPLPNQFSSYKRRTNKWTGVSNYIKYLENTTDTTAPPLPQRKLLPTPASIKEQQKQLKHKQHIVSLQPLIDIYRQQQLDCSGQYNGMNCYNTLFVGRLAYEVTERKLLREMEAFGPVKDIKIVYTTTKNNKDDTTDSYNDSSNANITNNKHSRGYAFIEYEHEEDMKRAYRAADGMRIDGREIVVDVERGHTVPTWLPRRLGGGLGGTRIGGYIDNVTRPGRYDPSRPENTCMMMNNNNNNNMMPPMGGPGGGAPPPMHHHHQNQQPPPHMMDNYGGGGGSRNMGMPPFGGGGGGGYGNGPIRGGPPPPQSYGGGGGGSSSGGRSGGYRNDGPYGPGGGGGGGPSSRGSGDPWGGGGPSSSSGQYGGRGGNSGRRDDRDGRKRQRSRSPPDSGRYGGGGGGGGDNRRRR